MTASFQAPLWLPGGHLQTLWRRFASPQRAFERERQRLELPDGDFVDLDWLRSNQTTPETKPLIFLLHGLAGSSDSPYILSIQTLLQQNGYDSVAMNLRGCSGSYNRLAVAYHSGCSHDVEAVLTQVLSTEEPSRTLVVIGYSLGANVLVKWLTETSHRQQVAGAVSVSNPFALALCCERMNSGLASVYGRYFLNSLRRDFYAKIQYLQQAGSDTEVTTLKALGSLDGLKTLWDFDDAVTAPLHGFAGARDYYERCSSRQFLPRVRSPLLIVHALNDPIIPQQALPGPDELPDGAQYDYLPAGGHVGFVARSDALWLERRLLRFIESL